MSDQPTAIVFAYHNVGCRCLSVLLAHGVRVPLVVTHQDDVRETIWFESVAALARSHDIPVITPTQPNDGGVLSAAGRPDFLFSFYYRHMLSPAWLERPTRGALNMHGSLLPKYRGRAPVNWAILKGERETGATLHYMVAKPDAGDIVAQQRVPILPNDDARHVLDKVTVAAELILDLSLPQLIEGRAPRQAQRLEDGSYYSGRRPEDGQIDWSRSRREIHDLIRAVAPPYPGAFTRVTGRRLTIHATRPIEGHGPADRPSLLRLDGRTVVQCGDGGLLRVLRLEIDGLIVSERDPLPGIGPLPLAFDAAQVVSALA